MTAVDVELLPAAPFVGSLSPSRAGDFMTCPLLYRFRTVDRLPQAPSPAATRGTLVHAVLERLFDLPAPERTPEAAGELLAPAWERLREQEPEVGAMFEDEAALRAWLGSARELLAAYFDLEDPRRLEPARREEHVEVVLADGLRLRGIVDRVDIAPGGAVRVVDYKTGRAPGERHERRALFQMRFYALVLWRTTGVVPTLLQLMYLGDREVLRCSPDEADLLATERTLRALWAAIDLATRERDFRPSPSRLCSWCDHQALCPAFGGTPPPWPEPVPDGSVPGATLVPGGGASGAAAASGATLPDPADDADLQVATTERPADPPGDAGAADARRDAAGGLPAP